VTPWRTYADPPQTDPGLTRDQRRERGRQARDDIGFDDALRTGGTHQPVWMCADALDAVVDPIGTGRPGVVMDAAHVDDALPGPWERDLVDLARRRARTGRSIEALAEGYQQGVAWVADVPLHEAHAEALRRARRLARDAPLPAALSHATAVRRLVSRDARVRPGRAAERWGGEVTSWADPTAELAQYRESLPEAAARILAQYRVADAVAGPRGQLLVVMARGSGADDVILLEAVPAQPSSREVRMGAWREGSDVQRVLLAREAVPLVPAEFMGWSTSPDGSTGRAWSRARASTAAVDLGSGRGSARRWGTALGLLHAASADAAWLTGYIGRSRRFPAALRDVVNDERALLD
jgi:hypothetical protein